MPHSSHDPHSSEQRRRTHSAAGRGFFIALAICLIAVGGVAAVTFSDSVKTPPLITSPTATTLAPTTVTTTTVKAEDVAVTPATTATVTETATTATQASSLFVLPLSNVVLSPFSEQPIYSETMGDYRAHIGVDFDGEESQPVRALADGTVIAAETDPLWGNCITIDHGNGITSIYRGITASIDVGQTVAVGDNIGAVGSIPCESAIGPHLHLELYKDGKAVDASTLLSGQLTTKTE